MKNPKIWQTVVSLLMFAVISLAYFHPDATEGNTLRQHDMMQGQAIGQETQQYEQETGVKSWWTNSLFGGMPTYQISPTYPSDSLISWLTKVYGGGLPSPANLLFMMMTGFFILMLAMNVRWEIGVLGAIAWGLSSYFVIIIGAGHIWKFVTLAYIPPTIAGVILCYNGRLLRGGAVAAIFATMQLASNHIQMTYYFCFVIALIVAGYLVAAVRKGESRKWLKATGVLAVAAILAAGANLPGLYNTYAYSKNTMRGQHSELTQEQDNTEAKTDGLDRDYITQYSYGTGESFSLLIPDIRGGGSVMPVGGNMVSLSLDRLADPDKTGAMEMQYLQYVSRYFGEPEGTNGPVYVGAIVCALFLLGAITVRGSLKWALVAATLLSVFLALGRNCMWLTDLFIDYVPMYSKFRTVESILVIAEFTIPLLGVLGLAKFIGNGGVSRKALYISFGVPVFLCLCAMLFPTMYGPLVTPQDEQVSKMIVSQLVNQGYSASQAAAFSLDNPSIYQAVITLRSSIVEQDALRSLMYLGFGFILLFTFSAGKIKGNLTAWILAALVLIDLYGVDKRYLNHESFCSPQVSVTEPFPMTAADRAILGDTAMNYRVMNLPGFFQAAPSYRHKAVGGYHAAKLTRYQDIIDRHLMNILYGEPSQADVNVANMLNTKYFVYSDKDVVANPEAAGNAWFAETLTFVDSPDKEMQALSVINPMKDAVADRKFADVLKQPSQPAPNDTVFETTYAPDRLTYSYDSEKGGLIVLSEIYYPDGWKADVDGTPVEIGRVNYLLRAVNVPAGHHTLTLRFDPDSVRNTTVTAYICIAIIYLLVILAVAAGVRKSKKGE